MGSTGGLAVAAPARARSGTAKHAIRFIVFPPAGDKGRLGAGPAAGE